MNYSGTDDLRRRRLTCRTGSEPASADTMTSEMRLPFWPGFAPVYLAQELGYFAEDGLTVEETFDDDRRTMSCRRWSAGDIGCDMRTVGEFQGRPRAPETKGTIIGTIDISLGGDGVLVESGIRRCRTSKARFSPPSPTRQPASSRKSSPRRRAHVQDLQLKDIASADAIAVLPIPRLPELRSMNRPSAKR